MGDHSNADFSGYATKANVKCSDGKTISPKAFAHMDKQQLPLVWQHAHNNPENVLGHAIFEARDDGVYAYGYFNSTKQGQDALEYVTHKDIKAMSIYANSLKMQGQTVVHGEIREVSLVLAGANPGALIDWVQIKHSSDPEDIETLTDEAFIHTGLELEVIEHAAVDATIQDIYDTFDADQKEVVAYIVSEALAAQTSVAQSAIEEVKPVEKKPEEGVKPVEKTEEIKPVEGVKPDEIKPVEGTKPDEKKAVEGTVVLHQEGTGTVTNVFEQAQKNGKAGEEIIRHAVTQDDLKAIYQSAKRFGSLNDALDEFALAHGIENVEALFPDPKLLTATPDFNSRNMAWVQDVLDSTRKSPFASIKTVVADLTQDEARAKGYITGNFKKEEWISLTKRTTTPTTIYKKQKLDRDDVLDIVDFDVVSWLKGEMRIMLSEEIAVAILLGDGREVDDADHVADPMGASSGPGVRSIMNDDELYVTRVNVDVDDVNTSWSDIVDQVLAASEFYKGTGAPTFYGTQRTINKMLLSKDANLHRNYDDLNALAAGMGVQKVVAVEPLLRFPSVLGIVVNLTDYNVGTDRGGEVNMFDFFDIDYNQMKYLMETRISGAMVKLKGAMILTRATGTLVEPKAPTFVASTGVVTIVATTGVVYKNADTNATLSTGAQTALSAGATLNVKAFPTTGNYFSVMDTAGVDEWTFKRPSA